MNVDDIPDMPTIGAYLRQPGVTADIEARRAAARWRVRMQLADFGPRRHALTFLVHLHESVRCGRRLDRVAVSLRELADDCDRAPQRRCGGGWPVSPDVDA